MHSLLISSMLYYSNSVTITTSACRKPRSVSNVVLLWHVYLNNDSSFSSIIRLINNKANYLRQIFLKSILTQFAQFLFCLSFDMELQTLSAPHHWISMISLFKPLLFYLFFFYLWVSCVIQGAQETVTIELVLQSRLEGSQITIVTSLQ